MSSSSSDGGDDSNWDDFDGEEAQEEAQARLRLPTLTDTPRLTAAVVQATKCLFSPAVLDSPAEALHRAATLFGFDFDALRKVQPPACCSAVLLWRRLTRVRTPCFLGAEAGLLRLYQSPQLRSRPGAAAGASSADSVPASHAVALQVAAAPSGALESTNAAQVLCDTAVGA